MLEKHFEERENAFEDVKAAALKQSKTRLRKRSKPSGWKNGASEPTTLSELS